MPINESDKDTIFVMKRIIKQINKNVVTYQCFYMNLALLIYGQNSNSYWTRLLFSDLFEGYTRKIVYYIDLVR